MSMISTGTNNHSRMETWNRLYDDSDDDITPEPDHQEEVLGDTLEEPKADGITRIYFQNLNGIKWDKEGGTWPMICEAMSGIQVDIMGFAEVNQDTSKYEINHKMARIAKRHFDHTKIITSTSSSQVRRTYKPGGTMMMTVQDTVSLAQATTRDRMGRWVSTRYKGQSQQRVTMITAYQVSQDTRTGKSTAVNQQINMILEESVARGIHTRTKPRDAFIQDLSAFIQQRQSEGDQIILVGDFNETVAEPNSGIARLMGECNLADACAWRIRSSQQPSTYKRGRRRLDFALMSPTLLQHVKRLGYDPFDYRGIHSDHRGMYIDLDTQHVFGNHPTVLAPIPFRDFTADRPDKVTLYINKKLEELNKHNIIQRLEQLENMQTPDHEFAEKIDKDMIRAATIAAKHIKAHHKYPWSPELAKAWATIHLWKTVRSQLRNPHLNIWDTIKHWQTRYDDLPQTIPATLREVNQLLREAQTKLKEIRNLADEKRQAHLDQRANLYAMLEEAGKETIIRRIRRAEDLARCYQKLKYIRQVDAPRGVTELKVPLDPNMDPKTCPKEEEYWRTTQVPEEITQLLITRNRHHFGQAQGTPPTQPQIMAEVKYDGTGETADIILNGHYNTENLDEASRLFIKHMSRQTMTELSSELTAVEFIGKLKNWPEQTSTSPSGIHLGHYHALWKPHDIDPRVDPEKSNKFEERRAMLIRLHLALINYSVRFGYSYRRWQKVVNIMLRKDTHHAYIHRLRVIHLYEADYNLLLAVKWRHAMRHSEEQNLLNEGIYGSRAGRSAHDPIFVEIMQNEIYRASMKTGIHKDLDATSCYDRIPAWVANVCSRRMGIHRMVAAVNCKTLEKARFHLKNHNGCK